MNLTHLWILYFQGIDWVISEYIFSFFYKARDIIIQQSTLSSFFHSFFLCVFSFTSTFNKKFIRQKRRYSLLHSTISFMPSLLLLSGCVRGQVRIKLSTFIFFFSVIKLVHRLSRIRHQQKWIFTVTKSEAIDGQEKTKKTLKSWEK